jgi:hypothetical protein
VPARLLIPLLTLLVAVLAPAQEADAQSRSGSRAGRQAQRAWWVRAPVRRSKYYVVQTDLPDAEARAYGRHLDRMYEEFSRRLAALPPRAPEKLNVYVFAKRADYLRTLKARYGLDGGGTGGMFFINPLGSGLAFWTEKLPVRRIHHVIQHEGFHQFAYSRFGGDLPPWVNEGLAEFFGESVLVGDDFILGQSTPTVIEALQEAIEVTAYVPFIDMVTLTNQGWRQRAVAGNGDLYYEQAWSMVHFLAYGDGGRYQQPFEQYLRLINQGILSQPAFVQVFGDDLEGFERRWREYMRKAGPSSFLTALERIEFLAEGALALSRRKIVPGSLSELRDELRSMGFSYAISTHSRTRRLDSADDANFTIPADGLAEEKPIFVATKPRLRQMTRYTRKLEDEWPTPTALSTRGVEPKGLSVKWIRDKKTKEIRYEIVVE